MLCRTSLTSAMPAQKVDILSQQPNRSARLRQALFAIALLIVPPLTVITAIGVVPGAAYDGQERVTLREPLDMPELAPLREESYRFVTQERVLRGDTVGVLFERLGIRDSKAMDFLRTDRTGRTIFRQLVPGRMLQAEAGNEGELVSLRYFLGPASLLEVTRSSTGFSARQRSVEEAPRLVYKSATIRSSLFAATDSAAIPDAVAMQVARIFATDIDFHTDLRKGDRFTVVYEMIYDSGELVAPGRILAAEFINGGRTYHAVLFTDDEGLDAYYSLDGTSRAKAFLRSPLEFSRVSSGFGARFHPIFKNWRAHTGVDFAAAQGTRVLATSDGHVISAGSRGGYGNAIEIRHGGGVTTLYAHLSAFASGVRAGARIRRGDPVGYVGSTGYATGPHLHYEFKAAGVHQDPLRVALPKAEPVPARLKEQFLHVANQARATIQRVSGSSASRFE